MDDLDVSPDHGGHFQKHSQQEIERRLELEFNETQSRTLQWVNTILSVFAIISSLAGLAGAKREKSTICVYVL